MLIQEGAADKVLGTCPPVVLYQLPTACRRPAGTKLWESVGIEVGQCLVQVSPQYQLDPGPGEHSRV
jgi:hypothetical protein